MSSVCSLIVNDDSIGFTVCCCSEEKRKGIFYVGSFADSTILTRSLNEHETSV